MSALLTLFDDGHVPAYDLNFLGGMPAGLTYTNSSTTRYYETASGVYSTAAANVPIFEYRNGILQGMRLEMEQRTNIALWNRDLTNAAWVSTNGTPLKDQAGIDGVANSASSFTATAGNATCLQSITSASAARVTSFFLKRISGTGTVNITQDNGATWTAVTLTSSWQRFQITATLADPIIGIRVVTSGDSVAVDFAQHETPASTASSPILTTTAAVIRQPDALTSTGISSWYRVSEGTIVFEGISTRISADATTGGMWLFSDGTDANRIVGRRLSGNTCDTAIVTATALQGSPASANSLTTGSVYRTAHFYKVNDFGLSLNGGTISVDNGGTIPSVNALRFGQGNTAGTQAFMGYARRFSYYNTRLPNSQIQGLSRV